MNRFAGLVAAIAFLAHGTAAAGNEGPYLSEPLQSGMQKVSMAGDARKQFMSSCLSGNPAETKGPHCTKGKPCGNSCIAMDKVCHK